VRDVRNRCLEAYRNQMAPFERIVEELRLTGESDNPLVQITVSWQEDLAAPSLPGLRVSTIETGQDTAKFDLTLFLKRTAEGIQGHLEYSAELYKRETIERLACAFAESVTDLSAWPERKLADLQLVRGREYVEVVEEWNRTERDYSERWECVHEGVAEQCGRTPDRVAVCDEEQQLSFGELRRRVRDLGGRLRSWGAGPERLVGVCVERGVELTVALLAVLESGAGYVPIVRGQPRARLEAIVRDAGLSLILANGGEAAEMAEGLGAPVRRMEEGGVPEGRGVGRARAAQVCYMLYTSGSTGEPKGVAITHGALANHMHWMQEEFALGEDDSVLQKTALSFDAAVWEFYAPLLAGARLVMAREGGQQDPGYVIGAMQREQISILQVVPSVLRLLIEERGLKECGSLRRVFSGGEALERSLAEGFAGVQGAELCNLYGPTEACIDATYWRYREGEKGETIAIGRPIANLRAYVMEGSGQPAGVGVKGELYLAGAGLARGYGGHGEWTAWNGLSRTDIAEKRERGCTGRGTGRVGTRKGDWSITGGKISK